MVPLLYEELQVVNGCWEREPVSSRMSSHRGCPKPQWSALGNVIWAKISGLRDYIHMYMHMCAYTWSPEFNHTCWHSPPGCLPLESDATGMVWGECGKGEENKKEKWRTNIAFPLSYAESKLKYLYDTYISWKQKGDYWWEGRGHRGQWRANMGKVQWWVHMKISF